MSPPIVLYGTPECEDTEQVRQFLQAHGIPFKEVNINEDQQAEQFVLFINGGYRSTPTVVIGEGKVKMVLTEPSSQELAQILHQAGYSLD